VIEKIFKALANKRRLAIIVYIKKKGQANVGDIAETIKLSFRSTSKHLNLLTSSGILDKDQRGLNVNYSLASDQPSLLKKIIDLI